MNRGYVKIWRCITDNGLLCNAEVCRLFLYLMIKAAYKPRRIMVGSTPIELSPGQCFIGRKVLAARLDSSEQRIRTALKSLQKMGIITQKTTTKGTIVSIVNWSSYQDDHTSFQRSLQGTKTSRQPEANHAPTTSYAFKTKKDLIITDHTLTKSPAFTSVAKQGGSVVVDAPETTLCPETFDLYDGKNHQNKNLSPYLHDSSHKETNTTTRATYAYASPEAGIEFAELREYYDKTSRPEAPMTGLAEFKQAKAAKDWPGLSYVLDAITRLATEDEQWKQGKAVGLARFIKERWWNRLPRASLTASALPSSQISPEKAEVMLANLRYASRMENRKLVTLLQSSGKE